MTSLTLNPTNDGVPLRAIFQACAKNMLHCLQVQIISFKKVIDIEDKMKKKLLMLIWLWIKKSENAPDRKVKDRNYKEIKKEDMETIQMITWIIEVQNEKNQEFAET